MLALNMNQQQNNHGIKRTAADESSVHLLSKHITNV